MSGIAAGRRRSPDRPPALGAGAWCFAVVVLIGVPWLVRPTGETFDHNIHEMVAREWWSAWRQGVLWPPALEDVNAGFGSLWPAFYPPLFHAACATGLACGLDYYAAAGLVVLIARLAGTACCVRWLRRSAGERAALWGGLVFAADPYFVFQLYHRGAFPEAVAAACLPGILSAVAPRGPAWSWRSVAAGGGWFGLVLLTNLPAAVVVGTAVAVYLTVALVLTRQLVVFARGAASLMAGTTVAAFVWVPVLLDMASVRTPDSDLGQWSGSPYYYRFGHHRVMFGGALDWVIEVYVLTIQACLLAAAWRGPGAHRVLYWCGLTVAAAALYMVTEWAEWVYRVVPVVGLIQFPWRYLGPVGPPLAGAVAAVQHQSRTVVWPLLVGAGWIGFDTWLVVTGVPVPDPNPHRTPARVLPDYVPRPASPPNGDQPVWPAVEVSPPCRARVDRWEPGRRVIELDAPEACHVMIRTYAHPRWVCTDQDGTRLPTSFGERDGWGRLGVSCPPRTARLTFTLAPPPGRNGAALAGAVACGLICAGLLYERRGPQASRPTGTGSTEVG